MPLPPQPSATQQIPVARNLADGWKAGRGLADEAAQLNAASVIPRQATKWHARRTEVLSERAVGSQLPPCGDHLAG